MEQTLENGIADNLLHNIFNDLSVGLELYDKDGLMIDVNYSRLRSMGIKDKKDILGYNLFNYTSFSDEIKEQVRKGETVRFMAKYNFDDVRHLFPTNLSGIKFFEITVSFVHNEKSEIMNYMVISQDVTERVLWQNKYDNGSVVILGGLSLVNSLHAYTFASLKRKKLISTTPLNDALNALILALNASAAAFVLLFTKKFRILS